MADTAHNRRRFKLKAGEYDWYKEQVANDPEFLERLRRLASRRALSFPRHNSPVIQSYITNLANDYDLTVDDVDELLITIVQGATTPNRKGSVGFDLLTRQATVTYSIDKCSDTEARELLEQSLAVRRRDFGDAKARKRRLPEDTELLYAIHRAHKRNLDRDAIHDLYISGELTTSKPNLKQYSTPAELMAYYYRHTEDAA